MEISENPLVRWISNIRDHGLEYASRRFYSLYSGKVDDNADTTFQGRIKAKIGALGIGTKLPNGTFEPSVLSRTALPSSIYAGKDHGVYFPPEIGDNVWMSFDHGDPTRPNPHYAGSYWSNTNPALASVGSDLPAEFRTTYAGGAQIGTSGKVVLKLGSPLNRGIKTRFGHGLIFSDDETAPYVALWSGQQVSAGQEAIRRQELKLSDDPAEPGVFARTFYGHKISMNDKDQTITISGISPDPTGLLANSIKIEDLTGKITVRTKLQQIITIDDATLSTSVVTPGQVAVTAGGACSITAASIAMASGAGGPATETGAGSKVSNFVGDITETVGGAFTQNVIGIMNLTAASLNLTAVLINFLGVVVIGPAVTARPLANDYLIDFVLNHQHPTAVPGPPSIATPSPISTIVTPGLPLPPITLLQYATSMLRAT